MMPRFCYTFELLPGTIERYDREHAEIWPGVVDAMRAAGVIDYSLFRRGHLVIATGSCDRPVAEVFATLDADAVNVQWSTHIRQLMHDPLDEEGNLLLAGEIWRLPPRATDPRPLE